MADIFMRIIMSASSGNVGRIVGDAARQFGSGGLLGSLAKFAPAAIVAGAALGGIGAVAVISVKAAADFQQALLSLVAHAGLAKSQFDNVSTAVLNMSTQVGRSPTELANALYPILSGFSGISNQSAKTAISLLTLKDSFETVAGTTTDGTAVANAAIGTFNALGLATNNAGLNAKRMTNLFDVMDKTVQLGNMHWDQYKNVVAKLAIAIQGTGIKFNESQAALALLTNEGFSAQKAATYLNNLFGNMAIKMGALATHAKKLGIAFDEHKYAAMSLADRLKYLDQITGGNKDKMLALLGGSKVALQAFNALKVGAGGYKSNLDALNHSQGALKSSFDTASQGFNFHMQQLKAAFSVVAITIGNQLLPVLTKIVTAVTPIVVAFAQWIGQMAKNQLAINIFIGVVAALATIVLAVVIPAIIAWVVAMWPILAVGAAVGAVVFGIIMAIQHWGQITQWLGNVWKTVSTAIGNFFSMVGTKIHEIVTGIIGWFNNLAGVFKVLLGVALIVFAPIVALILGVIIVVQHWGAIMHWFGNVFSSVGSFIHSIIDDIGAAFSGLGSLISGIWNGIVGDIRQAINWIIGLINGFISGLDSMGVDIGPIHIHPSIPQIPYLARGALDFAGGLAYVHAGEVLTYLPQHANVYPANRVRAMSSEGGGFGGTTNNFYLNISTMAGSRSEVERLSELIEQEIGRKFRGQTPGYASGGIFG